MNAKYNVALALLAGVAVGAAAVEVLHAQAKAPAYTIAEIDVSDPAGFKAYADANTVGVPKAGGRFLVRGGKTVVLDGAPPAKRVANALAVVARAKKSVSASYDRRATGGP